MCISKKSTFIIKQEASALLSNLGLNTALRKISLGTFRRYFFERRKFNEIVNNFLLQGDNFISGFTDNSRGPFNKNK